MRLKKKDTFPIWRRVYESMKMLFGGRPRAILVILTKCQIIHTVTEVNFQIGLPKAQFGNPLAER